jgi:hypothetical protein
MRLSSLAALAASIFMAIGVSGVSQAATLDFGILAPTPGTLSFGGGTNPLIGTGIEVDNITGLDTSVNAGLTIDCENCVLGFSTGNSTGGWNFGSGGSITVTGTASAAGTGTDVDLLSGSFNNATIVEISTGLFEFQITGGSFTDTKDPDLLKFYGLPTDVGYIGGFNLSFSTTAAAGDDFSTIELFSGDIVNQPVPIPAAVWLFGSGLLGLVGIARRRS